MTMRFKISLESGEHTATTIFQSSKDITTADLTKELFESSIKNNGFVSLNNMILNFNKAIFISVEAFYD